MPAPERKLCCGSVEAVTAVPPQPTLTDGEITLRPWRDEDVDLAYQLADDEMVRWFDFPGIPPREGLAEAVERWRRLYADDRSVVNFVIETAHQAGPVGNVEVRRTAPGVGQVSWTTYKPYRGQRIAQRAVRLLASYAFAELGLERLQAEVDPENTVSSRVAVRSGFRREGVLRGHTTLGGERRDLIVYGLRRDDPQPDTLLGWTALMDSVLPRKRVIAHVVVRDTEGRVLLCRTGFKRDLELPGGVVEPNEDPLAAARREIREELGVDLPVGDVVAIDWLPPWQGWGDAIELLYDGGIHDPALLDTLEPDGYEILAADWHAADQLDGLVSPLNARRLPRILADPGKLHQLRDGR
jgi:RimJ/RimL family protein N-acetyltransferase/8-oxo-dGTP pyrophosphatase MutT (NUDIX family)